MATYRQRRSPCPLHPSSHATGTFTAPWQVPARGGGGDTDGVQPPPKMLGALPIRRVDDVFDVFKMDVIEAYLSEWGTHPEYSEIRRTLLKACGVGDDLFSRFEASLSPVERGNLLDAVDDLKLGYDFSDARDRFIDEVKITLVSVLTDRAITAGNGGPPHRLGSAHNIEHVHKAIPPWGAHLCPLWPRSVPARDGDAGYGRAEEEDPVCHPLRQEADAGAEFGHTADHG